ncbi:MAG: sensor domain-containing diguanylate cyclase, partial [Candidatus Omnitrophota bacterium]
MIKIPKKQLFKKFFVFQIILFIALPVVTFIYFKTTILLILIIYFLNFVLIYNIFRKEKTKKNFIAIQNEECLERNNILEENLGETRLRTKYLSEKIKKYESLKDLIESLSQNFLLDDVLEKLSSISFKILGIDKSCIVSIYLLDQETHQLILSLRKDKIHKNRTILSSGDIFDIWVLKHVSPLLIEDIKKDFRFDLEKINHQEVRETRSLISVPMISNNQFIGILRLDSPYSNVYSQEDLRLLAIISDLGAVAIENIHLYKNTEELAIKDSLTGLYLRRYLMERLEGELRRASIEGTTVSLLMIDIDNFKHYNDQFGHIVGDVILKNLSKILLDTFQEGGFIVSRFGGEEFAVILSQISKEKAKELAESLSKKIASNNITVRREMIQFTVSMGIASFPQDAIDKEKLILQA